MDKQTNTQIPINTRTIGTPEGIYILYMEDYVHTFIKKILATQTSKGIQPQMVNDYNVEEKSKQKIALYGKRIEDNGKCQFVISGAAIADSNMENIKNINDSYFQTCEYIGMACADYNKDLELRIELTMNNTTVIIDDFYIYYDQNEEMQNYLVEWNMRSEKDSTKNVSVTDKIAYTRERTGDAAKLGRIAQAYNREEAKVSFMWNVMNVLCLGFVVCVMAYGIISVNNYSKMQLMEKNIDYLMTLAQNNIFSYYGKEEDQETLPVMQHKNNTIMQNQEETQEKITQESSSEIAVSEEMTSEIIMSEEQISEEQILGKQGDTGTNMYDSEKSQMAAHVETDTDNSQTLETPQYYVVRKGDTLRTICYSIYGDYSHVDEICQWNNIKNPDNILYGQKLLLP